MNAIKQLFEPLSRDYCDYFYIVSVLTFVTFLVNGGLIVNDLVNKRTVPTAMYFVALQMFVLYFTYRLFYSMCKNSLSAERR